MNRINTEFIIEAVNEGLFPSKNALLNAAVEMMRVYVSNQIKAMEAQAAAAVEAERAVNEG